MTLFYVQYGIMNENELAKKSLDILHALEQKIGTTIGLGLLIEDPPCIEILSRAEGRQGFAYRLDIGFRCPLHTSAPGKVLLAYRAPAAREPILEKMDFKKYTPNTSTSPDDFKAELADVLEKGFSIDVSEQLEGGHCVGVPVFDIENKPIAAIWATGPSIQLPVRNFERIADTLRKGAQELSLRLREKHRSPNRDYINSVVMQAREIIERNLNQSMDMKALAANLYVSYSWFRKAFKEQIGEAPSEYHLNRRIEKACELLRTTELSVRQISEEIGFKNQNHFSALFKRKTGLSPSRWRLRCD